MASGATSASRKMARPWSKAEVRRLRAKFPELGATGCLPLFKRRSLNSIRQKAIVLDLAFIHPNHRGLVSPIPVDQFPRVLAMHKAGASCRAIGRAYGVSSSSATNALAAAKCRASGRAPAKRSADGGLMIRDLKRVHAMLEAGARGIDIQTEIGISASSVSTHRRRLNKERAAAGLPLLPPAGGGDRYAGARLSADDVRTIEKLFMKGYGSRIIATRTGISGTTIKRHRDRLIARLACKGQVLPGCDASGKRISVKAHAHRVTEERVAALRLHILGRLPVQRAARLCGVGISSAYRIRNALAAELAARGEILSKPILPGRSAVARRATEQDANAAAAAVLAPPRPRRLTFDEQLQRVRNGAGLTRAFKPTTTHDVTLGGVSSGMLG